MTDLHIDTLRRSLLEVARAEISFSVDGGSDGGNEAQKIAALRTFVQWARRNVDYLPGGIGPEEFIWQNMVQDALSNGIPQELDSKDKFVQLTMRELGRENYETVIAGDILQTQERRLTSIDDNHAAIRELKDKLESFANR